MMSNPLQEPEPVGTGSVAAVGLPRLFLTVDEVASVFGCSRDTVTRLIEGGQLPAKDLGTGKHHSYRVKMADLDVYLTAKPAGRQNPAPASVCRRGRRKAQSAYQPQIMTA